MHLCCGVVVPGSNINVAAEWRGGSGGPEIGGTGKESVNRADSRSSGASRFEKYGVSSAGGNFSTGNLGISHTQISTTSFAAMSGGGSVNSKMALEAERLAVIQSTMSAQYWKDMREEEGLKEKGI